MTAISEVLFLTDRGTFHQKAALAAAPPELRVTMLRAPSETEIVRAIAGAEVVISERSQPVSARAIAAAPHLKLIVRLGSLPHGIDVEVARQAGVMVSVQPVETSINAAEHVLMMALVLSRRLRRAIADIEMPWRPPAEAKRTDEDTFAYNWCDYPDLGSLHGRTFAIVGMGEIGVELLRRLRGFGPRSVLYSKRARYPEPIERALGVEWASPEACFESADVVVSLLPYSPETDRAIGAAHFGRMKKGALLVHAGSGAVIDEAALLAALRSHQLAGAALDTFELEPLPLDSPLRLAARDPALNLVLTPHIASGEMGDRSADFGEVMRLRAGQPLSYRLA